MKNNRLLIVAILLFGLSILPAEMYGQKGNAESIINPEMTLTVTVEKANYFPWEPITVKARFENKTDTVLTTLLPYMLMDGTIVIETGAEKREFSSLTVFRSLLARQPTQIKPGENYDEEFTLESSLDEFFPRPGTYTIYFVLNSSKENRLVSNSLEITIDNLTGIDKKAIDFIKRNKVHQYYPMLFSWDVTAKASDGRTLLEEFVSKYDRSVYGDSAILQLGTYYFARGELGKAKLEFDKIRNSSNPRIAKEAKNRLNSLTSK